MFLSAVILSHCSSANDPVSCENTGFFFEYLDFLASQNARERRLPTSHVMSQKKSPPCFFCVARHSLAQLSVQISPDDNDAIDLREHGDFFGP